MIISLCRHPDKNKNPGAEDMFIKITKSYEVSRDSNRIYQYESLCYLLCTVKCILWLSNVLQICAIAIKKKNLFIVFIKKNKLK